MFLTRGVEIEPFHQISKNYMTVMSQVVYDPFLGPARFENNIANTSHRSEQTLDQLWYYIGKKYE